MTEEDIKELEEDEKTPTKSEIPKSNGPLSIIDLVARLKKSVKNPKLQDAMGVGSDLRDSTDPANYILMPEWFQEGTGGVLGVPFGKGIAFAGKNNSGKTAVCLEAIRQALAQGVGVIYAESENKTGENDLIAAGIDPNEIMLVQEKEIETYFNALFTMWEGFKDNTPDKPLLVVLDSIGALLSKRDAELDFDSASKPGGKGSINRRAINKMVMMADDDNVAMLFVTYTYMPMGFGYESIIAGGEALSLACALMYETKRAGKITTEVKGVKKVKGAKFKWVLRKNHLIRSKPIPDHMLVQITDKGFELTKAKEKKEKEKVASRRKKKR